MFYLYLVLEVKDTLLFVCACVPPGRAVEEQLCELTRLVLRLPEVDSLLQRAGLQPSATRTDPRTALEMFVKVTDTHRRQIHCSSINKVFCVLTF